MAKEFHRRKHRKRKTLQPGEMVPLLQMAGRSDTLNALLRDVLKEFKGTKGLAHELRTYYENCTSGAAKGRILESVLSLMRATAPGDVDPAEFMGDLTTEEIQSVLADVVVRAEGPAGPEQEPQE